MDSQVELLLKMDGSFFNKGIVAIILKLILQILIGVVWFMMFLLEPKHKVLIVVVEVTSNHLPTKLEPEGTHSQNAVLSPALFERQIV